MLRFRKRLKAAEASEPEPFSRRWQASPENPLGQIVVVPPPPPDSPTTVRKTDAESPPEEMVIRRKNHRLRKVNGKLEDVQISSIFIEC